MNIIYTDNIDKATSLNLNYKILKIELYEENLKSIFLIFNSNYDIHLLSGKGFVITDFLSDYSDFEIKSNDLNLKDTIDYFFDLLNKSSIEKNKKKSLNVSDDLVSPEYKKEEMIIDEISTFKGIYIKNILIKNGNIRFIPIYEVFLYIFKEKFNGKLLITKKSSETYSIFFKNGEITYINSFIKDDNFQYFLKKYGYISEINKEVYLYPVEKQLNIYISSNSIFKHERDVIYKDYISFLFRNIISLNSGEFQISDENENKKLVIFNNYFNFLYNFINYFKNIPILPEKFNLSDDFNFEDKSFNNEIKEILNEVKNNKLVSEIQLIFSKYDKKYIINILYFLRTLEVLKDGKNLDDFNVSTNNINENISQRIKIWMEKIKKENYFNLLGVNINDNEDFIEDKFRNLFSQFSNYLSSEELRIKYRNELEDIIFELESAYNVIKNKELKEKYYNKMLK